MKKILMLILGFISMHSFAQPWQTITGNGQIKKETRNVAAFTAVAAQGSFEIEITYGNSKNIEIEADENLLPYIETTVENGKLTIKQKNHINLKSRSKIIAHVPMTKITLLQLSGSGNIRGEGAFSNDGKTEIGLSGSGNIELAFDSFKDLDLALSGSGNMKFKSGKTGSISAKVSGSGNIDCSNISSNEADIQISGSGNMKINAKNTIDAKIAGSGNVFL